MRPGRAPGGHWGAAAARHPPGDYSGDYCSLRPGTGETWRVGMRAGAGSRAQTPAAAMELPTKEIEDFESNSLKYLQPEQIEKIWLRLRGL